MDGSGLAAADVAGWVGAEPTFEGRFDAVAASVSGFLTRGLSLLRRLPAPRVRSDRERAVAEAISSALDGARQRLLRTHVEQLYDEITDGLKRSVRLEQLVYGAAARVPGLTPTRAEMDAERGRRLSQKEGVELAQGLLVAHVLASPRAGRHLIGAMLAPTAEALDRLDDFRSMGVADLGSAHVERRGRAGIFELRNPRHLNAEDGITLGPTELGIDLLLLDPAIEIGVLRGGVVEHPKYAGERLFGSGINLTHLHHGRIDFLFYLVRDLGYVHKIYRGLDRGDGETLEKLWIAAVERFAIGGGCQLLHVVDHVIATRGSRLYLPARKEGIIPGASNLRLPRFVGDRAARQAILSGREWTAGEADAALLCDEVVEPAEMDSALESRIEALSSSGLVNASANRRALRVGQEPLDLFRDYMATYAREQAYCHLSPALVHNLEQHWNAHQRSV